MDKYRECELISVSTLITTAPLEQHNFFLPLNGMFPKLQKNWPKSGISLSINKTKTVGRNTETALRVLSMKSHISLLNHYRKANLFSKNKIQYSNNLEG